MHDFFYQFILSNPNSTTRNIEYRGVKSARTYLNVVDTGNKYLIITMPLLDDRRRLHEVKPIFDSFLDLISKWLYLVKGEVDAERRYMDLLNLGNYVDFEIVSSDDEGFSREEFEALKRKVQLLHARLDELQLASNQKEELKQEIDTTVRKAEEKGYSKQDFVKHLIGAIITRIVNWSLSQENLRSVSQTLNEFLHSPFLKLG